MIVWVNPENEELLIGFPRKVFNSLLQQYVYFCDKNKGNKHLQRILTSDDFLKYMSL